MVDPIKELQDWSKNRINFAPSTLPWTVVKHLMSDAPVMAIAVIRGTHAKYLFIQALVPQKLYPYLLTKCLFSENERNEI